MRTSMVSLRSGFPNAILPKMDGSTPTLLFYKQPWQGRQTAFTCVRGVSSFHYTIHCVLQRNGPWSITSLEDALVSPSHLVGTLTIFPSHLRTMLIVTRWCFE